MGEWGYGVGEREGCYGIVHRGIWKLLGRKGGGRGGGWVGVMGFGKPRGEFIRL